MAADICLLIAAERSGTHMLRSLLAAVPGVKAPGEVCNAGAPDARSAELSFLKFRENACAKSSDYFFPTGPVQTKLLDGYFAYVRESNPGHNLLVLDIKYPHVPNFNTYWWDMSVRPFILDYARKERMRVVHLVRRKVYRTALSGLYAQESGVWRAQRAEEIKGAAIPVERRKLEVKTGHLVRTIGMFDDWIRALRHIRITYEELTEPQPRLERLRHFLGLAERIRRKAGFVKTTPPYEQAIANYAEIADLLDVDLEDAGAAISKLYKPRDKTVIAPA